MAIMVGLVNIGLSHGQDAVSQLGDTLAIDDSQRQITVMVKTRLNAVAA